MKDNYNLLWILDNYEGTLYFGLYIVIKCSNIQIINHYLSIIILFSSRHKLILYILIHLILHISFYKLLHFHRIGTVFKPTKWTAHIYRYQLYNSITTSLFLLFSILMMSMIFSRKKEMEVLSILRPNFKRSDPSMEKTLCAFFQVMPSHRPYFPMAKKDGRWSRRWMLSKSMPPAMETISLISPKVIQSSWLKLVTSLGF